MLMRLYTPTEGPIYLPQAGLTYVVCIIIYLLKILYSSEYT